MEMWLKWRCPILVHAAITDGMFDGARLTGAMQGNAVYSRQTRSRRQGWDPRSLPASVQSNAAMYRCSVIDHMPRGPVGYHLRPSFQYIGDRHGRKARSSAGARSCWGRGTAT